MSLVWNAPRGDLSSVEGGPSPLEFHRALPDYAVTPLVELPDLACELGISAGASGAAGLAGLLALAQGGSRGGAAERLRIDRNARVLVLCTESAG